jgi:hypothetical protein
LHSVQGIGVRPARYSSINGLTTLLLEALFKIHDVIGNAEMLSYVPRVVHIVDRAAATGRAARREFGSRRWFQSCIVRPTEFVATALAVSPATTGAVDAARHRDGRGAFRHRPVPRDAVR